MSALEEAIKNGQAMGKTALYFGCWEQAGHYLHGSRGNSIWKDHGLPPDLPWDECIMDSGFLKNAKVPDVPNGKVYWTCGGAHAFWYAFYWWDRSVDTRGACNSGFYVRGFGWPESQAAFDYACEQFPTVVQRQKFPLVLQEHKANAV
jgi:hypothetical protein